MSVFSTIAQRIKEIINKMIGRTTIEQTLHINPTISAEMENAIQLWQDMYKNHAPWLHEPSYADASRVTSLGLPSLIASEKARMALLEWQSEITAPKVKTTITPSAGVGGDKQVETVGNSKRAEYLDLQYKKLKRQIRRQLEYGIAMGGLIIKPYVVKNETANVKTMITEDGNRVTNTLKPEYDMEFDFIQADNFYPLAFDANGKITEAAFIQSKTDKGTIYRRLEYHKFENNTVTVINKAYKSSNTRTDNSGADLGNPIPLTAVPEWSALSEETVITDVDRPLFAYFKMPEANTIDTLSPLGVSGYSRVVNLIKDADMQYSRLLWEYEGGEMAIDVDRDALREWTDEKGVHHTIKPILQQRLFREVDLGNNSDTYEPFAPALRDNSYTNGLNSILMHIEDATGLSRGTLSDVGIEAKTATEIKILKQRSYSANSEIQRALQYTLEDVIYIMDTYCHLYEITPDGEYDVSFEWDDSILVDMDTELSKRLSLQQNGLVSKVENRMWYFGETERQAIEALDKIKEETLQDMEDNMAVQSVLGNTFQQSNLKDRRDTEDRKTESQKAMDKKDETDNERKPKDPKKD